VRLIRTIVCVALSISVLSTMGTIPAAAQAAGVSYRPVCPSLVRGHARCLAEVVTDSHGNPAGHVTPIFYGPAEFHGAYSLPCSPTGKRPQAVCRTPASFGGQTIAVIDAYSDPNIESDLATYDSYYGLPGCTIANGCLSILNQYGQSSPLPSPDQNWAFEISLDVETAHEICQTCRILLIEANTSTLSDLYAANDEAATLGATEISNSWHTSEYSGETADDSHFNHPGVVTTFSTGDQGYGTVYPAASPFVVAVGGTTLNLTRNGRYGSESVWKDSGSGCSLYETANSWQTALADWSQTGCGTKRGTTDVSADADPTTGAGIFDSFCNCGVGNWFEMGGTSLASPIIAGVFALAGGVSPSINAQSVPYAQFTSTNSHDVTSGSNGSCGTIMCNAAVGYDGPSGLGTPNGAGGF